MKKIKLLFLLLLVSTMAYSQSLFKDKNGILSPTASRSIGVPSLYNFAIGDTSILRLRSGITQFYNSGTWYSIPVPSNYVAYADSITKYMTPNSFLSAFDTRLGTKTTSNLAEGTNLYYTDARARASISETITGIDYSSGVFSLASTYFIPRDSMAAAWNDKYTQTQVNGLVGAKLDTTFATALLRSQWSTAYTDRMKWDGGSSGLVAATGRTSLGLGTMSLVDSVLYNAKIASIYAPLNNPTFTGTVTIPTPFTLGAVSVTTTPQQFNYLNGATGTTGATTSNLVFSASPSLTGKTTVDSLLVNNLTSGYLPYYGGTRLKNSGIYYDPITSSIGIGTTPGAKLDVLGTMRSQSAGGRTLSLSSVDSGVTWQIWAASGSTGDEFRYGSGSDFPLTFYTNNAEVMRIRNGSIGIGTVTVLSKTGIAGNLAVGATYGALAAPTSGLIIEGRTLIGTSTDNTVDLLQVNGSVSFGKITTSGAFKGSSSTRGTDSFTTTATADTVVVSGATVSDVYMITYTTAVTAAEAPPSVVSTATGFIVTRPAGTTSGATYAWMRQE